MKSIFEQVGIFAIVVACAALGRVAWAETPLPDSTPRANRTGFTDEQLQEALDRYEGSRFRDMAVPQEVQLRDVPALMLDSPDRPFRQLLQQINRDAPNGLPAEQLRELLEIRRRIEGVADSAPEDSPTMADQIDPAPSPPASDPPIIDVQHDRVPGDQPSARRRDPRPSPSVDSPHLREHRCVAALRATARDLDQRANDLELCELYEQADATRELAQRLRIDARRIAGLPHGPEDAHAIPFGFTDPPAPHHDHPWAEPGPPPQADSVAEPESGPADRLPVE